jgi:hypothetical protein
MGARMSEPLTSFNPARFNDQIDEAAEAYAGSAMGRITTGGMEKQNAKQA